MNDGAWNFAEYKAKYVVVEEILSEIFTKMKKKSHKIGLLRNEKNILWKSLMYNWFVSVCFFLLLFFFSLLPNEKEKWPKAHYLIGNGIHQRCAVESLYCNIFNNITSERRWEIAMGKERKDITILPSCVCVYLLLRVIY